MEIVPLIGEPEDLFVPNSAIEYYGKANLLKAGLMCADLINTTSKSYAKEIQTSNQASQGLKAVFRIRSKELYGVINGVDYSIWNPEIDSLISHKYSKKDLYGKLKNKQELVESHGLRFNKDVPVIGIMLNFLDQQCFDEFGEIIDGMMKMNVQFIMAGSAIGKHQKMIQSFIKKYPDKIALNLKFDESLYHLMIAGCDMFLIPCKFEPCGSVQLRCLKYGTIPIVFATGGLLDTVKDFQRETKKGTGFVFREYSSASLLSAVRRAIQVFNDKDNWKKLLDRAMKLNFSWQVAAENYNRLYDKLMT